MSRDILEVAGALRLPKVIALQSELPTHDPDQMLREQTCRKDGGGEGSKGGAPCYPAGRRSPSGRAWLKLRAVMMFRTSLSMLFAMPGY